MARYDGKNLSLTIGGTEVKAESTQVTLEPQEATNTESQTFAEAATGGGQEWLLTITGNSDYAAGSFWSWLWENSGQEGQYVLKPYGNETASAEQPHFTGTITVPKKPGVGGSAGQTWTYEAALECKGEPAIDRGTAG